MIKTKSATICDVAKKCSVSTMTVTRAFRGDMIAKETRRRVMAAATDLGYRPNVGARIMRGSRTMSAGILFSNPVDNPVVRRLSETLMKEHYVSYVADTLGDPELTLAALRDFRDRRVDLIVMYYEPAYLPFLDELNSFPHLVLAASVLKLDSGHDICFSDKTPAYREALSLLGGNGKKVWFTGRSSNDTASLLAALVPEYGHSFRHCETSVFPSAPLWANHADALREALRSSGERPECLFMTDDVAAAQAVRVLREFGIRVPEDCRVAGSGNAPLSDFCEVPIASIDLNYGKMAEHVVETALARLRAPDAPQRKTLVPATFAMRRSFQSRPGS